ncbi:MAG: hypothetical protein ACTHK0_03450 [Ginsengibacter sp.]
MKKNFLVIVLCTATFFACNHQKNKAGKDAETYRTVPVPNVNGNIPDTSNSIDLGTKKDTSHVKTDSTVSKGK